MPIKKLDEEKLPCLNPEHNLPTHIYLEPGKYEWECPSCGDKIVFCVPGVY